MYRQVTSLVGIIRLRGPKTANNARILFENYYLSLSSRPAYCAWQWPRTCWSRTSIFARLYWNKVNDSLYIQVPDRNKLDLVRVGPYPILLVHTNNTVTVWRGPNSREDFYQTHPCMQALRKCLGAGECVVPKIGTHDPFPPGIYHRHNLERLPSKGLEGKSRALRSNSM
jgi:hypothetical protein